MEEYSFTDLGKRWNVDRTTVWRWWNDGRFQRWRRKGPGQTSDVLIPVEEVERFEREHNLVAPPPHP
jgi:hypothetical protein